MRSIIQSAMYVLLLAGLASCERETDTSWEDKRENSLPFCDDWVWDYRIFG